MSLPGNSSFAGVPFDVEAGDLLGTTDWQRAPTAGVVDIPFGAPVYQLPEGAQAPEERTLIIYISAANWAILKAMHNVWASLATPDAGGTACFLSHWGEPHRFTSGVHRVAVTFRR